MKNKKLFSCMLLSLLMSCGDEIIDVPLDDQSGKIVIEGNVTDEPGPYFVKVSKTVKISESIGYQDVANAQVVLSDNKGQSEILNYEDGVYVANHFSSHYGDTYTLSVTVDNTTYNAQSTMPELVNFDALKQKNSSGSSEGKINLIPVFKDPESKGNYYLFKTWTQSDAPSYTVLSDNIGNGQINTRYLNTQKDLFKNDTVSVEMQSIDLPIYNYFMSLPKVIVGNAGVSGTTANPVGNISNGALGYFSAHTSQEKSVVIQ